MTAMKELIRNDKRTDYNISVIWLRWSELSPHPSVLLFIVWWKLDTELNFRAKKK